MIKKILSISLLCLVCIVNAQEIKQLSLKEAVSYALENKADAQKSKLAIENSEYQIQEVRSRAMPQITGNGSLVYNPILQTNVIDGSSFGQPGTIIQATLGQKWNSIFGVSLNQTIFDQSVFTGLKAAKTTREFYQINNRLTQEQVIEKVANSYYQVYLQRLNLQVLDSTLVNTIKAKNIIEGQYQNGLAKKIDLDRIIVKISNFEIQQLQIINALQLQENTLKFFMGMPITAQIEIPEIEFEFRPSEAASSMDTENRTEYLLLKKQEQLLTYQKMAVKAEFYPTLSLTGGYNYLGQGPDLPWFKKPEDNVYWSDFSSIGLNLKIPIFAGFGTRSKVRQADIDLQILQEDIKDTELALDLDYENARTQINNSIATIDNQTENVRLAQAVLDNTRNNFVQGLAPLTDLLDAENALTEARNNFNTAILQYKLAEILLLKAKGELMKLTN